MTPGDDGTNATKWQRIEPGDLALFSKKNVIFSQAFVAAKVHAPDLAQELWGRDDAGQTWEFVYFLDEVERMNWPVPDFNEAAEYKPNNVVRGFNVLNDRKSQRVMAALDIVSDRYRPDISEKQYLDALQELAGGQLDTTRVTAARVEQQYLRQLLFGRGGVRRELLNPAYFVATAPDVKLVFVDPEFAYDLGDRRAGFGLPQGRCDLLRGMAFSHGQSLQDWNRSFADFSRVPLVQKSGSGSRCYRVRSSGRFLCSNRLDSSGCRNVQYPDQGRG